MHTILETYRFIGRVTASAAVIDSGYRTYKYKHAQYTRASSMYAQCTALTYLDTGYGLCYDFGLILILFNFDTIGLDHRALNARVRVLVGVLRPHILRVWQRELFSFRGGALVVQRLRAALARRWFEVRPSRDPSNMALCTAFLDTRYCHITILYGRTTLKYSTPYLYSTLVRKLLSYCAWCSIHLSK